MKTNYKLIFCLLGVIVLMQSCANYKMNYSKEAKTWRENVPPTNKKIKHSMYLIGDTGDAKLGKSIPHFKYLKEDLTQASENSSIVFLGDNIYPVGMPPKSLEKERALAEHKIDVQLDMLEGFKGRVMFIPGNHDWSKYYKKGLRRQEKYIENSLEKMRGDEENKKKYFMPNKGCGDPEIVEINQQLVVILIDSQWWLQNWDSDQSINDGCEIKTRAGFFREFENIVRKYRNRNVVIAMHHPLYSGGQHGGHYTAKEHLFPLRFINKKLYIPLPGIGSVAAFYRGAVGVPQDLANAKYKSMRDDILAAVTKNGNYIIAAGHEHTLQYIEKKEQQFIVSGSGSKENAAGLAKGSEFSYGRLGYSKIDFYEDGSAWLYFYALNDNKDGMDLVFRKQIKDKLQISKENIPETFPEYEQNSTVKVRKPTNFEFSKVGPVHRAILGEHYSDLYLKDYSFNVLDLEKYKGGLTPIKRGGGNQTNSLRLENADGKEFVMRALTKDASRALTYPINKITAAKNILQDNFMSAYPFAAIAAREMAVASNIYHTNPKLFYIPKQPALDVHNDLFGGDVYLVEERPGGDWSDLASFGNSDKIISTLDLIEKINESSKHRIDQNWVARSRLFDMLIKDWDRHEDQWRWARFKEDGGYYYRPIPRDRDQPFAKYDGMISKILPIVNPFMRQLQTYSPDIKNIKWANWNTTYFDKTFLNELEWEDWQEEAKYIQNNVTDEVIEQAFAKVPEKARDEDWKELVEYTKKRRDNMLDFARKAYELKALEVDVVGTAKKELFIVDRMNDQQTKVQMYDSNKKGEKQKLMYERVFNNKETNEIHLYGLGEDDLFEIKGNVNKGVKIRIIGGVGNDIVNNTATVKNGGTKLLYYDSIEEENELNLGNNSKDKQSSEIALNTYDRRSQHHNPNFWITLPVIAGNPDDGLILGADATYHRHQFKKTPYGQTHRFLGTYSFATAAINFNYDSQYFTALGKWDILNDLQFRRNRFAFNYFGFGNETELIEEDEFDFNRVRQSIISLGVSFRRRFAEDLGSFTIGPIIERTRIEDTPERFITSPLSDLEPDDFEERIYAGVHGSLEFESLDSQVDPHKGVKLFIRYNVEANLEEDDFIFGKFGVGLSIFQALDQKENIILASQAGYESINGDFDFFKAPTIGGINNLRGFRAERFRGDRAFYHTTDLRIKLLRSINNFVPFTFGVHGGFEYGRVWEDNEDSSGLKTSYGGGFYLDPIDFLVISFGQYFSDEDSRFIFKLNHMF